jgi:hypothetical protein
MKTIKVLATAAFMSVANVVIAQDGETDNREYFRFGVKSGANFSNI